MNEVKRSVEERLDFLETIVKELIPIGNPKAKPGLIKFPELRFIKDSRLRLVVDIDKTLADNSGRALWEPGMKYTSDEVLSDVPIRPIVNLIKSGKWASITFLTNRDEVYKEVTEQWLKDLFPEMPYRLSMRDREDMSAFGDSKLQRFYEIFGNDCVRDQFIIVDDDPEVVERFVREGFSPLLFRRK